MKDEYQIIEKCKLGDRGAQYALYQRYCKAMFTTAYRITGSFEAAGEVLQDAFLQVFSHIGDFENRSTPGRWIKVIVVRAAVKYIQRRKYIFDQIPDDFADTAMDWGTNPLDTEYLEKAILALPEGARAVFLLAEVEGFAHREIAEILGISEGTSKSQLSYAKKRLREMLLVS